MSSREAGALGARLKLIFDFNFYLMSNDLSSALFMGTGLVYRGGTSAPQQQIETIVAVVRVAEINKYA
jgi:hypothetical protein